MEHITRILEILMLVAFGFSWPNNIIVSIKNKSTKGKSLMFLLFIDWIGILWVWLSLQKMNRQKMSLI